MNTVRAIKKLGEAELQHQVGVSASWHNEFKQSAYIFIGNLNLEMNEGDVVAVFSQ
jgi:RNA-binding motif X-linked protein 2